MHNTFAMRKRTIFLLCGVLVSICLSTKSYAKAFGFCKLACIRADTGGTYFDLPANVAPYPTRAQCAAVEPTLCQGPRTTAVVPLCAKALRNGLPSAETANWTDRDLVNGFGHVQAQYWCSDSVVPNFDEAPEPKRVPIPNSNAVPGYEPNQGPIIPGPGSGLLYEELPRGDGNVVRDLKDLVRHIYGHAPWTTILAVSAILIGLLGIKGMEGVFAGPVVAEPVTVLAALVAIVLIANNAEVLEGPMRVRFEKYSTNVTVQETSSGSFVFGRHPNIEELLVDEANDTWRLKTRNTCQSGTSHQIRRTMSSADDC